jgi:hypothetical protein
MPTLTASRGLITNPSELSRPDGALSTADNVNIDADNVIEPRRGFPEFGTDNPLNEVTKQLMTYKGRILKHYANKIAFDSTGSGSFTEFSGSYSELVNKLRIKYIESNSNLYFTTTDGIKKIAAKTASDLTSASGYITDAGGVKAVGFEALLKPSAAGWLPAQSKVGYKVLWATKDVNGNVIRGVPSSRVVISNTSQDINVGERFDVLIVNKAGITASQYFTFNTPTNGYGVFFDTTGTDIDPTGADLLGKQLVKVAINGLSTDADVAERLASVLSTLTDVEISLDNETVTISNVDGGDVLDATQGSLSAANVLVSKTYDGQTASGTPANVELVIPIPTQITSEVYFYELYRTAYTTVSVGVTLQDLDPGEEFQKVYEAPITSTDLVAGSVTIEDITPESFRDGGAFLYVNPISGEGITQANEAPPIAHDIALFRNSAFYANTKERHRLQFNLLSVSDFASGVSQLFIGNSTKACEYTFVGEAEVVDFTAQPKSTTVGNSYIIINNARNMVKYKVWFDKGIISKAITTATPATDTLTISNHGFADNDQVVASGTLPTGLPAGTYYVRDRTINTFKLSTTIGGGAIDFSGTGTGGIITHTPVEPTVADTISLRVALQTYADTLQGSADAFMDAFFDILDFEVDDQGSGVVRVSWTDNGEVTDPTASTPASAWTFSVINQGEGENAANNEVFLSGSSSVGISVEDTARSLERVINKDANCPVSAFYLSGLNDLPGLLLLESKALTDDYFYVGSSPAVIKTKFNPEVPTAAVITDITIAGNLFTTSSAHGFNIGQEIYVHDNPGGTKTEIGGKYTVAASGFTATTFSLVGVTILANQAGLFGTAFASDVVSDNSENANRVYFSKLYQPEAVPLVNFIDIGPKDKAIQRILALRDSLIVLKEDGVYVISGSSAPNFSVRLVDSSALTLAPDTAINLNNLIYVLTTQGVVTVSDTGVGVISRNIENKIQEVTNNRFDYKLTSWGTSSESDRCYLLFLPTRAGDTVATQAYRYNTFTRAWTRWTKAATCGVVNISDDRIYLGDAFRPYVLQERKNFERQDFSDREIALSLSVGSVSGTSVTISSAAELAKGDVLVQYQYVDINKFNRLLRKLDRDSLVSNDYYSTLAISQGVSLATALDQLQTKLVADGIAAPAPSLSNLNTSIRDDFNAITTYLNTPSSGTGFKDYRQYSDLLAYEVLIQTVNATTNTLTVNFSQEFVAGAIYAYKGYECKVEYAPQHFGKPEATKIIADGTLIFDQNNFWGGSVGYKSDRAYDYKTIDFSFKGPGYWDGYVWSNVTFGGEGNEVPVRTLIPRDKARCRYLHVQFIHVNAREQFKLLGVSLEPKEVSVRGYR